MKLKSIYKQMLLLGFCSFFLLSFVHAKSRVKVACVGNSVTYGYGLAYPSEESYPANLQKMLGGRYDVRNFGHSGATLLNKGHLPYVLQSEFKAALNFKPDLVVIHLGLNDTDPRNWPNYGDEFIRDYHALIDSFRVVNPKVKVWICEMTPIGHRHPRFLSGTRDWHAAIQDDIRRVSSTYGVGLIDLYTPFHSHPELFPDALHPNKEGAEKLARIIYANITGNYGGLQLPVLYSDGMVMQRNKPIVFKGIANADNVVKVTFNGVSKQATVAADGKFRVEFPAQEAGGPYQVTIRTKDTKKTINDIWIGDVWLCSGQSNMEFPVKNSASAKKDMKNASHNKNLHLFNFSSRYPTNNVEWEKNVLDSVNHLKLMAASGWKSPDSASVASFSAIAYHFGKTLEDSTNIPIGIICNAVGGTTTESWVERSTLENVFPEILYDWYHGDFGQKWARERALKNISRSTDKLQRHPYEPAYMFECAMLPLESYPISGVIWYQGESNAHNPDAYKRLFGLLEYSWRKYFKQFDLPFYMIQLSSLDRPSWSNFRNIQREIGLHHPKTHLVVSYDYGDSLNVHPTEKQPIGERVAMQVLHDVYGKSTFVGEPRLKISLFQNHTVVLSYDTTFSVADGTEVPYFELSSVDGVFHKAKAIVKGRRIYVSSDLVPNPAAVRYAWLPYVKSPLKTIDGYPLSTFRFDLLKYNAENLKK